MTSRISRSSVSHNKTAETPRRKKSDFLRRAKRIIRTAPPLRLAAGILIVSVVTSVCAFSVLETYMRLRIAVKNRASAVWQSENTARDRILAAQKSVQYAYAPFLMWKAMPYQNNGGIMTNAFGNRDETHAPGKSDRFRIAVIGASSVWGYGASKNSATIPARLEYYLNAALQESGSKVRVDVMNFGQPGYVSSQELLEWREALEYQPDIVIHFGPFNDIYSGLLGKAPGWNLPGINESVLVRNRFGAIGDLAKQLISDYLDKSALFYWIRHRHDTPPEPTDIHKIASVYVRNMDIVSGIAQAHHVRLYIVFQPSLMYGDKPLAPDERAIQNTMETTFPKAQGYYADGYTLIRDDLDQLAKQEDVDVLDLTQAFSDVKQSLYIDHVHTTDAGYDILAQRLSQALLPDIH